MARRCGHHETAAWLDSVAGFPAFRIAVVAGLAAVELVLAIGRADPDDCAGAHRAGVIAAAATATTNVHRLRREQRKRSAGHLCLASALSRTTQAKIPAARPSRRARSKAAWERSDPSPADGP